MEALSMRCLGSGPVVRRTAGRIRGRLVEIRPSKRGPRRKEGRKEGKTKGRSGPVRYIVVVVYRLNLSAGCPWDANDCLCT